MKIRAGFHLGYECMQPTPMLLVLNIHPSRRADLLSDQILTFDQPIEAWSYTDVFGNACSRIVAPPGLTTISTEFEIYDSGQPDIVPDDAVQHAPLALWPIGSAICLVAGAWSLALERSLPESTRVAPTGVPATGVPAGELG